MTAFLKTHQIRIKPVLVYVIKVLILVVIYHLAARLGLKMAYVQANTSPVWPPAGIAVAALLILGPDMWPGITLGVLLGSLLTNAPLNLAAGMSLGNTLKSRNLYFCPSSVRTDSAFRDSFSQIFIDS
jgi:integral membrane sensor domain MASE1